MKYSIVWDYTSERVREVSTKFKEWKDKFYRDNIPNNIVDFSFHILPLSVNSQSQNDQFSDETMTIELALVFKGKRNGKDNEELKNLSDIANKVKTNMIDQRKSTTGRNIKNVVFNSMDFTFPPSNDNIILFVQNYDIRLIYKSVL